MVYALFPSRILGEGRSAIVCAAACGPSFSVTPRDASAAGRPFRNSVRSRGRSVVTYSSCQNCGLPVPPRVELCKNSIADLLLRGSPLYQILVGMANVQLWLHELFDLYPTGSTAGHLTSRDARGIRITVRHSKHCKWRAEILYLAGPKTAGDENEFLVNMILKFNIFRTKKKFIYVYRGLATLLTTRSKISEWFKLKSREWFKLKSRKSKFWHFKSVTMARNVRKNLIELFCGVVCVVTLSLWHFCWYRGFCHRTGSDLLLFVLRSCPLRLPANSCAITWTK